MFIRKQILLRLVAGMFAVANLPAFGAVDARWRAVDSPSTAHVRFYVDSVTVRAGRDSVQVRLLYDFVKPQYNDEFGTYSKSYVVDSHIDCKRRQIATVRMSLYADNGANGRPMGKTTKDNSAQWASAPSGSINGDIVDVACRLLQGRR